MVIVAAVDRSERAKTVSREAESLAKAFGDTVHVVHVVNPSDNEMRQAAEKRDPSFSFQDKAAEVAEDAITGLEVPHETVGLVGNPADEIVDYAESQDARYIVVTGRKRSPTGKAVFGSVAQSVLLNAGCPVVTSIEHVE